MALPGHVVFPPEWRALHGSSGLEPDGECRLQRCGITWIDVGCWLGGRHTVLRQTIQGPNASSCIWIRCEIRRVSSLPTAKQLEKPILGIKLTAARLQPGPLCCIPGRSRQADPDAMFQGAAPYVLRRSPISSTLQTRQVFLVGSARSWAVPIQNGMDPVPGHHRSSTER